MEGFEHDDFKLVSQVDVLNYYNISSTIRFSNIEYQAYDYCYWKVVYMAEFQAIKLYIYFFKIIRSQAHSITYV